MSLYILTPPPLPLHSSHTGLLLLSKMKHEFSHNRDLHTTYSLSIKYFLLKLPPPTPITTGMANSYIPLGSKPEHLFIKETLPVITPHSAKSAF